MDMQLIGMCGAYCGACEWKTKTNCPGCLAAKGKMFWGICDVATCGIEKGLLHCGFCADVPCATLQQYFDNPEHGDNGERLDNLMAWAGGEFSYKELSRKKVQ
jgi:hypothetical protein